MWINRYFNCTECKDGFNTKEQLAKHIYDEHSESENESEWMSPCKGTMSTRGIYRFFLLEFHITEEFKTLVLTHEKNERTQD